VNDVLALLTRALPMLPTLIAILLIVIASRLARRLLRGGPETDTRGDFRQQLVQLVIGLVGLLIVVVVLPVGTELRGQLLSLIGIVLSAAIALASTTFVGNMMAGVMLKTVRNFRRGDFLQVGEQFGRVTERGLLSTEIQTEDRDLLTLPNLHLVTNPVRVVRSSGTIITAEVSLGYDVHHEKIESLLTAAAADAGLKDPFVLVMKLGDFAVTYRVAGLLDEVKHLLTARSRLRVAMLDHLHHGGVEIVSPSFMNQRPQPPEHRFIPRSVEGPATTEGPTLEEVAFDKADEAESLDQLVAQHNATKEALAKLDQETDGLDPEQIEQRKAELEHRLERLVAAIEARQAETN